MLHRFLPVLLLVVAGWAAEAFQSDYERAVNLFNHQQYTEARGILQDLLRREDRKSSLLDNCYFWMGECYYAEKAWLDALACYFKVLDYPRANKAEASRYKIARSWFQLGEREKACAETQTLLEMYPAGEFHERATRLTRLVCTTD